MIAVPHELIMDIESAPKQDASEVAALVHFSAYIAKEAQRLGIPNAAEKARILESELLSALATA